MSLFTKATKEQSKLRMALQGPSGSGKTYSALSIASHLGGRVAVIDTEFGSASKYADDFEFDVLEIKNDYHPDNFIKALRGAEAEGYGVVIGDSLTHFWNGEGGFLQLVDIAAKKMSRPDSFAAWKAVTPVYNNLISAILSSSLHVILTLRAKQEYVKEQNENGRTTIRKVGLAPEMRDNFQYEMDIEGMLNLDHELIVGKTRCKAIDGKIFKNPGKELADILTGWLTSGVKPVSQTERLLGKIRALISESSVDEGKLINVLIERNVVPAGTASIEQFSEDALGKVVTHWDHTIKLVKLND